MKGPAGAVPKYLVTTLVDTAKSSRTEAALAVPWRIERTPARSTESSFEATIDLPLLREWLSGIAWQYSPSLECLPGPMSRRGPWPSSQVMGAILRDIPCDLVRRTLQAAVDRDGEDSVRLNHYTLAKAKNRPQLGTSPLQDGTVEYLVDLANTVLAYPCIATSHMLCYACTMLVRAVGVAHGYEEEFMLRGCEACVDLPWIVGLGDGVVVWGEDVVWVLEEGSVADIRSLVVTRAEQPVERREVGVFQRCWPNC